jgi:hypothetical protein
LTLPDEHEAVVSGVDQIGAGGGAAVVDGGCGRPRRAVVEPVLQIPAAFIEAAWSRAVPSDQVDLCSSSLRRRNEDAIDDFMSVVDDVDVP